MNNSIFEKAMENIRNNRDITLVRTDKKRNQLISKPSYDTTKQFSEGLLAIEMKERKEKERKVKMNKPVNLGLSIV